MSTGTTGTSRCADEPPIAFDHLIVAAGSTTNYFDVDGAAEHGFPLYSLEDAIRVRNHMLTLFEAADSDPALVDDGVLNFVVVGGGPTGVEVSGALVELFDKVLEQDFHDLDVHRARVLLIEQADRLLAPFSAASQRYARRTLTRAGCEVRLGTAVRRIAVDHVELSSGEVVPTRLVVWAAGVRASRLADALGVDQGRGGRVPVDADLSIAGHREAFAIGDIADIDDGTGGRLPQLAQVAIQGGDARRRADPGRPRRAAPGRLPVPRQGHDGHDRAARRRGRAAQHRGADRSASTGRWPGWRGSACTSSTSSAPATGSRCSPTGPGTT